MRSLLLDLRCATPQLAICQLQFTPTFDSSDKTLVLVCLTADLVHMGSLSFSLSGNRAICLTFELFLACRLLYKLGSIPL